jgi:hypothetical protein
MPSLRHFGALARLSAEAHGLKVACGAFDPATERRDFRSPLKAVHAARACEGVAAVVCYAASGKNVKVTGCGGLSFAPFFIGVGPLGLASIPRQVRGDQGNQRCDDADPGEKNGYERAKRLLLPRECERAKRDRGHADGLERHERRY